MTLCKKTSFYKQTTHGAHIIIDNRFSEMQYQLPECHVELCHTTAKEYGKCYLLVKQ